MPRIKVLIPKDVSEFLKAIASTDDFTGEVRYHINETFHENTDGQLYIDQCDGNCGMNYCDENGCIERHKHLTEPTPQKS